MSVRKLTTLFVSMLIISTTLVSVHLVDEVEAVPQDPIAANPLDMDYVWFETEKLADIILQVQR